ncbi:YSC84-related protein [Pelagicoccus sp. SDUM812005]|uniref:BPSL1445 family SYLF domain-containing lipoprotein n=1 Tax=Pelagicoccus sp. SDUM812005 TaxID=3041257 RepID=UPI00280CE954|nr:YSC84-related protein [Pelagicoccus sp. SDUM812005]MDQ8182506.1 YSC84-related protein [Pelagicoccus sp. SDUM812005]
MKKLICLTFVSLLLSGTAAFAAKKKVLDAKINQAIEDFYEHTSAGKELAEDAAGMLVFPTVGKAGLGIGGEYGEGALFVNGKRVDYYSTASASIGFQIGVQSRSQIILFLEKSALEKFRNSEGWEVGVDGSVAIANIGAGGEIDSKTLNEPVVAFVFGNKGLMYNLSLEGSKITKIVKE